jgi:hypothetical protein
LRHSIRSTQPAAASSTRSGLGELSSLKHARHFSSLLWYKPRV